MDVYLTDRNAFGMVTGNMLLVPAEPQEHDLQVEWASDPLILGETSSSEKTIEQSS